MTPAPATVGELPLSRAAEFVADATRDVTQPADRCELLLRVKGSTFVTGHAAFEQAAEVAKVVAAVTAAGVPRDRVTLAEVTVESRDRVIATVTKADYLLRVEVRDLAALPDVMAAATGPKSCALVGTAYGFPDDAGAVDGHLAGAVAAARRRADVLAAAAGVAVGPLLGIEYEVTADRPADPRVSPDDFDMPLAGGALGTKAPRRKARRIGDDLPGPVDQERRLRIVARLRYAIGPPVDAEESPPAVG